MFCFKLNYMGGVIRYSTVDQCTFIFFPIFSNFQGFLSFSRGKILSSSRVPQAGPRKTEPNSHILGILKQRLLVPARLPGSRGHSENLMAPVPKKINKYPDIIFPKTKKSREKKNLKLEKFIRDQVLFDV